MADLKEPERFAELATKTFVAPIAHFHLAKSKGRDTQREMMAELSAQRLQTVRNYLFLKSEANLLSANLFEPAGVVHAFFKGTALADQFYEQPSLRHARDIDVLIARKDLALVIERGLMLGYRLGPEDAAMNAAERAFHFGVAEVTNLRSPRGALVEIHCHMDGSGALLDTEKILLQAEACEGSDFRRRLPSWLHVIYLCLHHTRHRWSHLHWLADLDAALSSPGFDLARTKAEAVRLGLWQCVEPCLRLHEALGRPEAIAAILGGTSNETCEVQDLARASVENLGRMSRELTGGSGVFMMEDFVFSWQMTATLRIRYIKWLFRKIFTPRLVDYQWSPLGQRIPALLPMIRLARLVHWRLRRFVWKPA